VRYATHVASTVASLNKRGVAAQGVWNATDGFVFTDPVIHHISKAGRRHRNGQTDKGVEGVRRFFASHQCNAVCRRLGLTMPSKNQLRMA